MAAIGKLVEVDVRELWKHEQYDFSNWLAKPDNMEYLNDILGLTLVDVDKEKYVGPYRCDIVAKDETSGISVIVENQLEGTDHDHLGKIITYASGIDAKVIVWIVKEAKEEHRAAIEWLNNNTNSSVNFFLIEIHAYKIGSSEPAPKFEVIEKPNDFVKKSKDKTENGELNKSQAERLAFWEKFNQVVVARGKPFNLRKPSTDHWYSVAVGSSQCYINVDLVNKDHVIRIGWWIPDNKALFEHLYEHKNEIEKDLGYSVHWDKLENKKGSGIHYYIHGLDFDNQDNYPELMDEIVTRIVEFRKAFKPHI